MMIGVGMLRRNDSRKKWGRDPRILLINALHFTALLSQAFTEGPKFAEPIPNVTVAVGRDVSLPCVVEHLGTHKVAWIHIDRQMILTIHRHVITRIPRFTVSYDNHKTWLLHVSSVQEEDRGYYMCQVNTEPMISQVGYLQVVVPPNIIDAESTESHVAVRENQNVTLSCKAEGFPTPKIMWRREDGHPFTMDKRKKVNVSEGHRLNLVRISRNEMGAYLCIASNGVPPSVSKRITVDVEFSPMIWVPNQLVGAPSGTDVTLECHSEAFPRSISYWVYDNVMVLSTKKYKTETSDNSYRSHMKLTVRNLRERDFGKYKCISKNSLGETEGSIRLYEIPLPSLPPKATEVRSGRKDTETTTPRNNSKSSLTADRSSVTSVSRVNKADELNKREEYDVLVDLDSSTEDKMAQPPNPQESAASHSVVRWPPWMFLFWIVIVDAILLPSPLHSYFFSVPLL